MSVEEFSNEFDTLFNAYSKNYEVKFGDSYDELDEYEKSVYLTKSQEEVVREIYSGKNPYYEGFESTEEVRRYLAPLVITRLLTDKIEGYVGLSNNSVFFALPDDAWFITYESVILDDENAGCHNGEEILVTPVTQDEYSRIDRNPFRRSSFRRALRLDIEGGIVEIVSDYTISSYKVRYLAKPHPIILEDLPDNLSINDETSMRGCDLNPAIHRVILERAVKLAIISKTQMSGANKEIV